MGKPAFCSFLKGKITCTKVLKRNKEGWLALDIAMPIERFTNISQRFSCGTGNFLVSSSFHCTYIIISGCYFKRFNISGFPVFGIYCRYRIIPIVKWMITKKKRENTLFVLFRCFYTIDAAHAEILSDFPPFRQIFF